jgi:hypothetical protein
MAVKQGYPIEHLKQFTGSRVVNLVDYEGQVTVPRMEPVEIFAGGTGFMLIKKEVFTNLKSKVNSYVNDVGDLSGTMGQDRIWNTSPSSERRVRSGCCQKTMRFAR